MYQLLGKVQHYHWGSTSRLPCMLGLEPDGKPWAEYWLGTHPLGPATLTEIKDTDLTSLIASHPIMLGDKIRSEFGDDLPFMLKILSARKPLSMQAHPSKEDAESGFLAEEKAGIPLASPERSYKDSRPKPELIAALTPFDALVGFRDPYKTARLFAQLETSSSLESIIGPLTNRSESAALAEVFLDLLSLGDDRKHLVEEVVAAAVSKLDEPGEIGLFAQTAVELDEYYPGSPTILAAMLMNHVQLSQGQALFLKPGVLHSYLKGTGIEIMGNSDNVLRGGLTKKRIDVDGLLHVVEFQSSEAKVLETEGLDGIYRYPTEVAQFQLWWIEPLNGSCLLPGFSLPRIALVTEGTLTLRQEDKELVLPRGGAAFISAEETISVQGAGQMFLAGPGITD